MAARFCTKRVLSGEEMPKGQNASMRVHPIGLWADASLMTASSFISTLSAVTVVITLIFRV